MLLIEWYRIDWFFYLPIILLILLVVIIILRIFRRILRWERVNVSHIGFSHVNFENERMPLYYLDDVNGDKTNQNPKDPLDKSPKDEPYLLLIPPLSNGGQKKYHLAVSLALMNWNVLVITPELIRKWGIREKEKPIILELLKSFSIKAIIAFDYSIPVIFNILSQVLPDLQAEKQKDPLKLILLRPIWSWNEIAKLWSLIPFTSQWWYRIRFMWFNSRFTPSERIFGSTLNLTNPIEKVIENGNLNLQLIIPQKNIMDHNGIMRLEKYCSLISKKNSQNINIIHQGGWSFYQQETLVYGWMLKSLR